jgi:hypothetical protein
MGFQRLVFLSFRVFFTSVFFPSKVLSDRAIPDDNLAYPVLIELKDAGSGSGLFLNTVSSM